MIEIVIIDPYCVLLILPHASEIGSQVMHPLDTAGG